MRIPFCRYFICTYLDKERVMDDNDYDYMPEVLVNFVSHRETTWFKTWLRSLIQEEIVPWDSPHEVFLLFDSIFVGMIKMKPISLALISFTQRTIVFYSMPEWRGKGTSIRVLEKAVLHLSNRCFGKIYCISLDEAKAFITTVVDSQSH